MGFMTEISILNDSWHEIQDDPKQLVDAISRGMNERHATDHAARGKLSVHVNAITVQPSHHADEARLYIARQNSFLDLSPYAFVAEFGDRLDDPDDHLLDALDKHVLEAEFRLKEAKNFIKQKRKEREQSGS